MGDRKRLDPVVVARDSLARVELDELIVVGQLSEDAAQGAEEVAQSRRPVDRDRHLAPTQRERLQHPGQAQIVVRMVVREEDFPELDEPDRGDQHLPLRALGTVEQQAFAAPPDEHGGGSTLRRRHRPGCAEKHDVEVHGAIVGSARYGGRVGP